MKQYEGQRSGIREIVLNIKLRKIKGGKTTRFDCSNVNDYTVTKDEAVDALQEAIDWIKGIK